MNCKFCQLKKGNNCGYYGGEVPHDGCRHWVGNEKLMLICVEDYDMVVKENGELRREVNKLMCGNIKILNQLTAREAEIKNALEEIKELTDHAINQDKALKNLATEKFGSSWEREIIFSILPNGDAIPHIKYDIYKKELAERDDKIEKLTDYLTEINIAFNHGHFMMCASLIENALAMMVKSDTYFDRTEKQL